MWTVGARSPMILIAMIEGGEQYEYTALLVTDAVRALALCRGPLSVRKLFAPAFVHIGTLLLRPRRGEDMG